MQQLLHGASLLAASTREALHLTMCYILADGAILQLLIDEEWLRLAKFYLLHHVPYISSLVSWSHSLVYLFDREWLYLTKLKTNLQMVPFFSWLS